MKRQGSDGLIFESTGRFVYANSGIVGITEYDGGAPQISEGYDGGIGTDDLTTTERIELADFVIAQWMRFKETATT